MNTIKTVALLSFLLFSTISIQSQITKKQSSNKLNEIFRFNAITYSGNRIFGIHQKKEKAIQIAMSLMFQDNDSGDAIKELKISIETIEKKKGTLIYEKFKKIYPTGYKIITKDEYDKLTTIEKEDLFGNGSSISEKN